ncbi:GNAT family N-acetyltransferase [Desulfovibrio sp. OttesenSCG-928-C06]|nr:GNAT family N-acetyltransferase [Desulfovibrio sp. OttesenSCG-928-C06]
MNKIKIGQSVVGVGQPVFFIAEIGVNHNGNLDLAHRMIDEAALAGAQAVKFQSFCADRIVTRKSPKAQYQLENTSVAQSQYEMLKELEVPEFWYPELLEHCARIGVEFISTPYDIEDIRLLSRIGVCAYKVPSAWAIDLEYLSFMARCGKPVLLATGMCTIAEVERAVKTVREHTNDLILLQCTTDYPTDAHECNVRVVKTLADTFSCLSGLSDHSQSHLPAVMAVALGACVIERHFTLDKAMPGPDHSSSDNPAELASLIRSLQEAQTMLGSAEKRPVPSEMSNQHAMRRSIVAARKIPAGTVLTREDLVLKRPAAGIEPQFIDQVVGRAALEDIDEDQHLSFEQVGLDAAIGLKLQELSADSLPALTEIFDTITANGDDKLFVAREFDRDTAKKLCLGSGRDYYAIAMCGTQPAGYVMLRGWDEGYSVPTAGIYILPDWRGKRLAPEMLKMLTIEARQRGAGRIMAKVYASNQPSLSSFARAGYVKEREEDGIVYLYAELS